MQNLSMNTLEMPKSAQILLNLIYGGKLQR